MTDSTARTPDKLASAQPAQDQTAQDQTASAPVPPASASQASAPCPCGGYPKGATYSQCCEPALTLTTWPPTAQQLMRSRYTAHVKGDEDHLFRTWHPKTRPARIDVGDGAEWIGLRVEAVSAGGVQDEEGAVEYRAAYREPDGSSGELHEVARFVRRARRWMYLGPAEVLG
ncbi:YchJ family protein [Brevibacterium salitolerans]|uniref:YchJ-like middle NTF2-like domain-containing protein n=1 Tax=Brevibacterium salitolerans TaxID=1403566 RepID=A0ABP5HZ75_9MICO